MSKRSDVLVPHFQRVLQSIFNDFSVIFVPLCFNPHLPSAQNASPPLISSPIVFIREIRPIRGPSSSVVQLLRRPPS